MLDSALTRRWRSLASSHIRKRGYRLQVPNFVSLSISMSTFSSPLLTTVVSVDASVRFAAQVEQSDTEARGARSQICLCIPKSLSWIIACPESFCCCSMLQSLDYHLLLDELFASLIKFQQECSWVLFFHPSSRPQGLNMILQLARFVKFNESQWPNTTRVARSEGLEPYPRKRDRPVGLVATQASRDSMHKCLHHRHNRARDTRYSRQRSHYRCSAKYSDLLESSHATDLKCDYRSQYSLIRMSSNRVQIEALSLVGMTIFVHYPNFGV